LTRFSQLCKNTNVERKIRLDKWLWAARFFKTRSLAKAAITAGKVQIEGQRAKVSKELILGAELRIKQGVDEKTVTIENLSDKRRSASEAATMYRETPESIISRTKKTAERKASNKGMLFGDQRPTKKQRRQIHKFNENNKYDA